MQINGNTKPEKSWGRKNNVKWHLPAERWNERRKGRGEREREREGAPPVDVPVLQNKQRQKMRNDTQTLPLVSA